jgi:hypothetical protein
MRGEGLQLMGFKSTCTGIDQQGAHCLHVSGADTQTGIVRQGCAMFVTVPGRARVYLLLGRMQ